MPRMIPLRTFAFGLCLSTAPAVASAQASTPHLRHTSAPFLGQALTLEVDGAVPNSPIDLYFSPEAGSYPTPFGVLELKRSRLLLLSHDLTDAAGSFTHAFTIPLDPGLAETGAHFQALVGDPGAPAGRVFSDAIHARFLGPRVYAGHAGGLDVLSGISDSVVASVSYDAGVYPYGKPVFDATFSRGAVMSTARELLFFDPFFGTVEGTMSFSSDCVKALITDGARRTVFVLESGGSAQARIHAVDLLSGTETSHLDLPNPAGWIWCEGSPGVEIFLGERDPSGNSAIRRVGMDPLADLGSGIVGGSGILEMIYTGGQVFSSMYGALSRSRVVGSTIVTRTNGLGLWRALVLTAMPDVDWIVAGEFWGPESHMVKIPISRVGAPIPLQSTPHPPEVPFFIEADGPTAWVVGLYDSGEAGSPNLWRLDFPTETWTAYPNPMLAHGYYVATPRGTALLRDAFDHELWIACQSERQIGVRPKIGIWDELLGTTRQIPIAHDVWSLLAVPLP